MSLIAKELYYRKVGGIDSLSTMIIKIAFSRQSRTFREKGGKAFESFEDS